MPAILHSRYSATNVCTEGGPDEFAEGSIYSGVSLPADQYVACVVGAPPVDPFTESYIGPSIRFTEINHVFETELSYMLVVGNGVWSVTRGDGSSSAITFASGSMTPVVTGDILTFAAIGTTLYFYQNTALIWSGTDTNIASGCAALVLQNNSTDESNLAVSNWSVGSASLTQTPGSFTPGNQNPPPPPSNSGFGGYRPEFDPRYNQGAVLPRSAQGNPLPDWRRDVWKGK
jgi:hypothetical protein